MRPEQRNGRMRKAGPRDPGHTVTAQRIQTSIHLIRGQKVLLDYDLANLYGVTTGNLNKAVQRNQFRFPGDFTFLLTAAERDNLIFQFGRSSWGGRRKGTRAFTEQGVAMLSSVLRTRRAAMVNVQIMRAFVRMRELLLTHQDLARKLDELEKKHARHDKQFDVVFSALRRLIGSPRPQRRRIGFHAQGIAVTGGRGPLLKRRPRASPNNQTQP